MKKAILCSLGRTLAVAVSDFLDADCDSWGDQCLGLGLDLWRCLVDKDGARLSRRRVWRPDWHVTQEFEVASPSCSLH